MSEQPDINWDKDPTPSPAEFEEMQKADPYLWWRIGCGHHENLYDAAIDEIERLRADMDQITGFLAGVGTVHTEDGALAGINALPSVQAAWERGLGATDE